LFGELLSTDELAEATGGAAWVRAMLDAEAALAAASADCGVLPAEVAAEIEGKCHAAHVEPAALGRAARAGGNPVIPLVAGLRRDLSGPAADWLHHGATSQDVLDTAAVLVATRAGALVDGHLAALADGCAALADRHRHTLVLARTLLQPALPTTFGAKAAGWLLAALDARRLLAEALGRLPASLGGAAGRCWPPSPAASPCPSRSCRGTPPASPSPPPAPPWPSWPPPPPRSPATSPC
jgi:3-carboxy-cis,cis-muconate cycloisomerase